MIIIISIIINVVIINQRTPFFSWPRLFNELPLGKTTASDGSSRLMMAPAASNRSRNSVFHSDLNINFYRVNHCTWFDMTNLYGMIRPIWTNRYRVLRAVSWEHPWVNGPRSRRVPQRELFPVHSWTGISLLRSSTHQIVDEIKQIHQIHLPSKPKQKLSFPFPNHQTSTGVSFCIIHLTIY